MPGRPTPSDARAPAPDESLFPLLFSKRHPFGYVAGVSMPEGREPVGPEALRRLDLREAETARALSGFRQVHYVGGRLAARAAAAAFEAGAWSVTTGDSGEPVAPSGFCVSIAHKQRLAVALVARSSAGARGGIGIDLEDDVRAARVAADLTFDAHERSRFDALSADERDRAYVLAFALKECAYKALAVRVGRPLGYHDASVELPAGGPPRVVMRLAGAPSQPSLDATFEWMGAKVIAAVRVREDSRPGNPSNSAR